MIDLQQLMGERSADAPDLTALRLISLRQRIVRRRRRTVAGTVAAVAAAVALVAGLTLTPGHRSAPDPAASSSSSPRTIDGFPEYAWGARVVVAGHRRVSDGPLTLTWTPTSLVATFFTSCTFFASDSIQLMLQTSVNGYSVGASSCDGGGSNGSSRVTLDARQYELKIGRPAQVTLTVTAFEPRETESVEVPVPADATVGLAVGERVDFADYPLPPRPSVLPSLPVPDFLHVGIGVADQGQEWTLVSDPADPMRPVSGEAVWTGDFEIDMASATPGRLRMTVDGVEITVCDIWDYTGGTCRAFWNVSEKNGLEFVDPMRPKIGRTVTFTVTPTHVTGPWQVGIKQVK